MRFRKIYKRTGKRTEKQKRKWRTIVLATGTGIVLAAGGTVCWHLFQEKQKSQLEAAAWKEANPSGRETKGSDDEILYQGKRYKRNSYMKAILLIGVDTKGEMGEAVAGSGGQADGLFLVAQDTARNQAKVLMIPRDTMTEIVLTDLSGNVLGKDVQHLTLAYAYGDGREQSCEYLKDAVSELLDGLFIDHYMSVNISALPILNDAVGGVTVTLKTEELESRDEQLKKGSTVTLKGEQAELFVRYRDVETPQSALERMERQKQYMTSWLDALWKQSAADSQLLPEMMEQLEPYMVTDMAKDQYLDMAMDLTGSGERLLTEDILTLPGEGVETELFDEYHADKEAVAPMILDLFYREVE